MGSGSERRLDRLLQRLACGLAPALRLAPPGMATVALDANCTGWLALSPARLMVESLRRGVWPVPLRGADLDGVGAEVTGSPSLPAREAAEYELCIRHEMLRDELARAMSGSRALSGEFDDAVRRAMSREAALELLVTRLRVRSMACMQGYTPVAAAMRGVAARLGTRIIAMENTLFADRITWDATAGIPCFTDRARAALAARRKGALPEVSGAGSRGFECGSPGLKSAEHRSGMQPVATSAPYVLFIGQVFTDSSVLFGCAPGWGPLEVVSQVRQLIEGCGVALVIKAHPKEAHGSDPVFHRPYGRLFARRLRARMPELFAAGDCVIDDSNSLDTYAAIRSAACAVTMNSQAGIESAAMGVPTILCAKAIYGDCGFTFDGTGPDALKRSLQACLAMPPEERGRIRGLASEFVGVLREQVHVPRSAAAVAGLIAQSAKRGAP